MKLFLDCEFTELTKNGELLSIALVSEDNKAFYGIVDREDIDPGYVDCDYWLQQNVIPNFSHGAIATTREFLNQNGIESYYTFEKKEDLTQCLLLWLHPYKDMGSVEIVADCGHYDFMHFIDLLSHNALNLPSFICPAYIELNQIIAQYLNISQQSAFDTSRLQLSKINANHDALYDALICRELYNLMMEPLDDEEEIALEAVRFGRQIGSLKGIVEELKGITEEEVLSKVDDYIIKSLKEDGL